MASSGGNPTATPQNFTRRGGSGFTIFTFGGQPIVFCQEVQHTSPQPVGQGVAAIQPMDEPYPVEIVTPAAAGMGTITLNLIELFGGSGNVSKVWDRLGLGAASATVPFGSAGFQDTSQFASLSGQGDFTSAGDIVDIFIKQATLTPTQMQIVQVIRPPATAGASVQPGFIQYIGCVITNVMDGETVDVGTLQIIKQITVAYRYSLRNGNQGLGFGTQGRDAGIALPSSTS